MTVVTVDGEQGLSTDLDAAVMLLLEMARNHGKVSGTRRCEFTVLLSCVACVSDG